MKQRALQSEQRVANWRQRNANAQVQSTSTTRHRHNTRARRRRNRLTQQPRIIRQASTVATSTSHNTQNIYIHQQRARDTLESNRHSNNSHNAMTSTLRASTQNNENNNNADNNTITQNNINEQQEHMNHNIYDSTNRSEDAKRRTLNPKRLRSGWSVSGGGEIFALLRGLTILMKAAQFNLWDTPYNPKP